MDRKPGYEPVACDFHDRLEELATLRRRVRLTLAPRDGKADPVGPGSAAGGNSLLEGRIQDIYTTESKEEFVRMEDETAIRLDRIVTVEEAPPIPDR